MSWLQIIVVLLPIVLRILEEWIRKNPTEVANFLAFAREGLSRTNKA